MPTHPAIFQEIAARYGHAPATSDQEVERFFARRFRRLPARQQDRIRFELLWRDGQEPRYLSADEVSELDALFEQEQPIQSMSHTRRGRLGLRGLAVGQAAFSAFVFAGIGLLRVLPEYAPAVSHIVPLADAALVAIGCLGNLGAALYESRRGPFDGRT